jgi:hypothetical protein
LPHVPDPGRAGGIFSCRDVRVTLFASKPCRFASYFVTEDTPSAANLPGKAKMACRFGRVRHCAGLLWGAGFPRFWQNHEKKNFCPPPAWQPEANFAEAGKTDKGDELRQNRPAAIQFAVSHGIAMYCSAI